MAKNIPITKPTIGEEEVDAVKKVVKSGFLVKGKKVSEVEELLANRFGRKYVIMLSSGTASLNTALTVLGLGKGDEVITTPFTFVATANAINYVGAKVIFADINPETYNISPDEIEKKITKKTKAIIAVDLFGYPADYSEIKRMARKSRLYLIEDAAQAHGSMYKGKPAGSFGDMSVLSFYGSKIVTSGEGGAILTNSKSHYEKIQAYQSHGISKNNHYHYLSVGYNFLPTDIQAAILVEQLKKLDEFVSLRNKAAGYYSKRLKGVEGIKLPVIENGRKHAFSCYTIGIRSGFGRRDDALKKLNDRGVGARVYYPIPLHLQLVFKKLGYNFKKGGFPNAELVSKEVISLPIFPTITKKEQDYVVEKLIEAKP